MVIYYWLGISIGWLIDWLIDWLTDHESDNDYDLFAMKICRDAEFHPQIVGHLPLEISRFTKFLLDRGATITATLSSTYYRRSPLISLSSKRKINRYKEKQRNPCKVSGNGSNSLYRIVIWGRCYHGFFPGYAY